MKLLVPGLLNAYLPTKRNLLDIQNLNVNPDTIHVYRYVMKPDLLSVAIAEKSYDSNSCRVAGGINGSGVVLGRNALRNYKPKLICRLKKPGNIPGFFICDVCEDFQSPPSNPASDPAAEPAGGNIKSDASFVSSSRSCTVAASAVSTPSSPTFCAIRLVSAGVQLRGVGTFRNPPFYALPAAVPVDTGNNHWWLVSRSSCWCPYGSRTDWVCQHQQSVVVAVRRHADHIQEMTRGLAFGPQALFRGASRRSLCRCRLFSPARPGSYTPASALRLRRHAGQPPAVIRPFFSQSSCACCCSVNIP